MKNLFIQFAFLIIVCFGQSEKASITIYKDDFGLVRQPVSFQLKSGFNKILYSNIPHEIDLNSILLSIPNLKINYQDFHENNLGSIFFFEKSNWKKYISY